MKRQKFFAVTLMLLFGLALASCKKDAEPLLITDAQEPFQITEDEESTSFNDIEDSELVSLIAKDTFLSKDADNRCRAAYVCESEKRIYFIAMPKNLERYYEPFNKYVFFIDKETGDSGYLCGKEGCLHDSRDCGAYISDKRLTQFSLYDGKLYAAFTDVHDGLTDIVLMCGETNGTGFTELGIIPADAYAVNPDQANATVCFHRGYFYTASTENVYENTGSNAGNGSEDADSTRFRYPFITEETGLVKRFRLDNLNISEELYSETLTEYRQSANLLVYPDKEDVYIIWEFENDDEERSLMKSEGALWVYCIRDGEAREELFKGEIPISLNGGVHISDGEVKIAGRNYTNDRAQLLVLDQDKKAFRELQTFESFTELDNYYGSYVDYGDGYYVMMQDLVVGLPPEKNVTAGNLVLQFFSENGGLLGKRTLNVAETMESLHLMPAGFGQYMMFYMNRFACDRDYFYGMLNITGEYNSVYQAVLRIPVDDEEPWQVMFEKKLK